MPLRLIADAKEKRAAQAAMERSLKAHLTNQGVKNVGYPGGNTNVVLYTAGERRLWAAFMKPSEDWKVKRFWNAYGVYRPNLPAQTITVEINIPTESNTAQVAAFFAKDTDKGDVYLMHSGKIGGGRPGIGKSAFLVWSKAKLVDVDEDGRRFRTGIAIGKLDDLDLASRIWKFVQNVHSFKEQAVTGALDTPEFKRRIKEFERYRREFSGRKRGSRGGIFAYLTYHGDVVQKLYDHRNARCAPGEEVFNSLLMDLYVKARGKLTEVYEVKTGVDRQMLYTAIGQVMTHSASEADGVLKVLVVPKDHEIPDDFEHAIKSLGIKIRHFWLEGKGDKKIVHLGA